MTDERIERDDRWASRDPNEVRDYYAARVTSLERELTELRDQRIIALGEMAGGEQLLTTWGDIIAQRLQRLTLERDAAREVVEAQARLIEGKDALFAAYRLGDQRRADKALTAIEEAQSGLDRLSHYDEVTREA